MSLLFSLSMMGQGQRTLFDMGWRFAEGDVKGAQAAAYNDFHWKNVNLPHDWDNAHAPYAEAPMGNGGGYYPGGIGWYRKTFATPKGKHISLHFEGVYQQSEVYVNGHKVGTHGYGYTPFSIDITPWLKSKGNNVVAVRVDNSQQPNCRWYSGSGIYRHVWMQSSEDVRIVEDGIFVTTPHVASGKADVSIDVEVENVGGQSKTVVLTALLGHANVSDKIATEKQTLVLLAGEKRMVSLKTAISNPKLWSTDTPNRYQATVILETDGKMYDQQTTKIGVRTIAYSASAGFTLNGQPVKLNGACVHHDNGLLGAASFDDAEIWKVKRMKEAGFNLLRTSHNPAARAFIEACDSLGMMVVDESFDNWYRAKNKYDYSTMIDSCWHADLTSLVRRDRNSPSVIAWSIGNEVIERRDIGVVATARKFKDAVHSLDSTRPVTEALCSWDKQDKEWPLFDPHAEVLDIVGYNYMMHHAGDDHVRCPERVMWQTESYPRDAFKNWNRADTSAYVIGDMVWTGLDYLGESGIGRYYYKGESEGEHYRRPHFPWHGAYCGDVDLMGWRKPISHYRDLLWNDDKVPTVYLAVKEPNGYYGSIQETLWSVWPTWERWNWKGHEGKDIDVEIYTRAPKVRLSLNGKVVAEKTVSRSTEYKAVVSMVYQPGELIAEALDNNGKVIGTSQLVTAGEPVRLRLTVDRTVMRADGESLAYVTVEVVDKDGHVVPDAEIPLTAKVSGAGTLQDFGSANLKDVEPLASNKTKTWCGRAMLIVRSTQKKGRAQVEVASELPTAQITVQCK